MEKRFLAYLSALGAAFFYSLNQIFNKKVVLSVGTLPALVVVYGILTAVDFLLCLFFGDFSLPSQGVLAEIVFLSAVGAISILLLFESFKHLPLGVAITLANLSPLFLTTLVFLFTGKLPSSAKLLAVALILFSIYLITSDGKGNSTAGKKVYLLPLGTAFGWAVFGWELFRLLNLYGVDLFALAFYTSLYMFCIFLAAFLALYRGGFSLLLKVARRKKVLLWAATGGILTTVGFILSMLPFKWVPPEDTPVVEAIFSLSTPLGALFSYLLLGERLNRRQTAGIFLAFAALVAFFVAR